MSRVLPILFNTEMVQAILEGRKTVTRRPIKNLDIEEHNGIITLYEKHEDDAFCVSSIEDAEKEMPLYSRYRPGDILYVRETWNYVYDMDARDQIVEGTGRYVYYADDTMPFSDWVDTDTGEHKDRMPWRPSIHMPKEAARIWLKVTDVQPQRLQNMTLDDFLKEGIILLPEAFNDPENAYMQAWSAFIRLWNSTIPKRQQDIYSWAANPWVWVIEFERCEKPEVENA